MDNVAMGGVEGAGCRVQGESPVVTENWSSSFSSGGGICKSVYLVMTVRIERLTSSTIKDRITLVS